MYDVCSALHGNKTIAMRCFVYHHNLNIPISLPPASLLFVSAGHKMKWYRQINHTIWIIEAAWVGTMSPLDFHVTPTHKNSGCSYWWRWQAVLGIRNFLPAPSWSLRLPPYQNKVLLFPKLSNYLIWSELVVYNYSKSSKNGKIMVNYSQTSVSGKAFSSA